MATQSTIEWTEQTWNPTTGCTKVSPGCKHCYAEVMARRLHAMGAPGYENEFKLTLHPDRLEQPMARKKPTTYFVNSMSDLFHEAVPDKFLDRVFSVIEATPQHTYAPDGCLVRPAGTRSRTCSSGARTAPHSARETGLGSVRGMREMLGLHTTGARLWPYGQPSWHRPPGALPHRLGVLLTPVPGRVPRALRQLDAGQGRHQAQDGGRHD